MPKVNDEYFKNKQNKIIAAALSVCEKKPVYYVTMADIVSECGISTGAVYKYYSCIEEVYSAIINKANTENNHVLKINEIVNLKDSPKVVLQKLFNISEIYFSDMMIGYNKILFELGLYMVYDPVKRTKIYDGVNTLSIFTYLGQVMVEFISKNVALGHFNPVMPLQDIFAYIVAAFDGIIRDVTLTKCYPQMPDAPPPVKFNEKKLIHALYVSTLALLGANDTKEENIK